MLGLGLQDALMIFDPEQVSGAMEPHIDELPRLEVRHQAALRFFDGVDDKNELNSCLLVLHDDDVWAAFDTAFRKFARSLDMLYPSTQALRFVDDARWLGKIRKAARSLPGRGGPDMSDCGAKVQKLIEDAVLATGVEILFEAAPLLSDKFDQKLAALRSPAARASQVEHALRHEIHVKLDENPAFYGSLKQRLEQIIEDYEQGRIDAVEKLQLTLAIRSELRGGGRQDAEALGLSSRSFAIYGALARAGEHPAWAAAAEADPNYRRDMASMIDGEVEALTGLVDWEQRQDVLKDMRRRVSKRLTGAKLERKVAKELAREIVDLTKRRGGK